MDYSRNTSESNHSSHEDISYQKIASNDEENENSHQSVKIVEEEEKQSISIHEAIYGDNFVLNANKSAQALSRARSQQLQLNNQRNKNSFS